MKKALPLLLALVMCLSLCACDDFDQLQGKSFEGADALLSSINGMWLVDDYSKEEFYVFLDGNIYRTNYSTYEYEIEELLEETLITKGLDAWKKMDFQASFEELDYQDILRNPLTGISYQPKKGTIVLDEGKSWQKKIVVTDSGVELLEGESEYGVDLLKIADQPTFAGEKFEEIFNRVKKECTAPSTMFVPTTQYYGDFLQQAHGQVLHWPVVSDTDEALIKSLDGTLDGNLGAFVLHDTMAMLSFGEKDADGNPYVLMYTISDNTPSIIIEDRMAFDVEDALYYAYAVIKQIPGALTEAQIYEQYMQERILSGGFYQFDKTVGAITYKIFEGSSWPDLDVTVMITVADTIPLADYVDTPNSGSQAVTRPSENTQPTTEPVEEPDVPTETQPTQGTEGNTSQEDGVLEQLLVPTKIWGISWTDDYGVTWTTDYVFDGAGGFKMLLADGMQYIARYQGTYTIAGNTVCIFNGLSDETEQYVYDYHPEEETWEQKSVIGFAYDHEKGDVFPLREKTNITAERFGELYDILGNADDWD